MLSPVLYHCWWVTGLSSVMRCWLPAGTAPAPPPAALSSLCPHLQWRWALAVGRPGKTPNVSQLSCCRQTDHIHPKENSVGMTSQSPKNPSKLNYPECLSNLHKVQFSRVVLTLPAKLSHTWWIIPCKPLSFTGFKCPRLLTASELTRRHKHTLSPIHWYQNAEEKRLEFRNTTLVIFGERYSSSAQVDAVQLKK